MVANFFPWRKSLRKGEPVAQNEDVPLVGMLSSQIIGDWKMSTNQAIWWVCQFGNSWLLFTRKLGWYQDSVPVTSEQSHLQVFIMDNLRSPWLHWYCRSNISQIGVRIRVCHFWFRLLCRTSAMILWMSISYSTPSCMKGNSELHSSINVDKKRKQISQPGGTISYAINHSIVSFPHYVLIKADKNMNKHAIQISCADNTCAIKDMKAQCRKYLPGGWNTQSSHGIIHVHAFSRWHMLTITVCLDITSFSTMHKSVL